MLESKEDSYLILTCLVSALVWVLLWICTNKSRCGSSICRLTHLPSAEDQREDSFWGMGTFIESLMDFPASDVDSVLNMRRWGMAQLQAQGKMKT